MLWHMRYANDLSEAGWALIAALYLLATPALAEGAGIATVIDGDNLGFTASASVCIGSTRW